MKYKLFIKTLLLLLILTLINCSSEDNNEFTPTLPEATQIGANTFGCYIDGKLLIPRNGTGTITGPDRGMSFSGLGDAPNYIYNEINVQDFKSGTGGIMDIHFIDLNQNAEGNFTIEESNCERFNNANISINIRCRFNNIWYCSIENSGIITISRYDFNNRILSGTFNCTVRNRDNPDELIEITEGRFDLKWDVLNNSIIDFP